MKLISIMIVALLLVGIGSAQNYMPEFTMEPGAGIEMDSTTPGDIEMWGGNINNASNIFNIIHGKYIDNDITVASVNSSTISKLFADYVCNGTDDYVTINLALADAQTNKKWGVQLSDGKFYVGDGTITVLEGLELRGKGSTVSETEPRRTIMYVTNTTAPAIRVQRGTTVAFVDAWYPDQKFNDTPTAYPAFIYGKYEGDDADRLLDIEINNVNLYNSYIGIYLSGNGVASGRQIISRVNGWPLYRGIWIDGSMDGVSISNSEFTGSYLNGRGSVLQEWVNANGIGFYMDEIGWSSMYNIGCYGYKYGYYSTSSGNVQISDSWFDGCKTPIYIGSCTNHVITNNVLTAYNGLSATTYDVYNDAIFLTGANNITISGNIIWFTGMNGVVGYNTQDIILNANIIRDYGRKGDDARGIIMGDGYCERWIVTNNMITGNDGITRGIRVTDDKSIVGFNILKNTMTPLEITGSAYNVSNMVV